MSLALVSAPSLSSPRKRTSSFCCSNLPKSKTPKTEMGQLRRSESFVCLPELESKASTSASASSSYTVPYKRSLRCYKDQREKRKALLHRTSEAAIATLQQSSSTTQPPPSPPPPRATQQQPKQYSVQTSPCRATSPLSPVRNVLPARPVFPRSKHEPDLYRQAITTRMRCTPEGQKILHMGPRLALSIMNATKELERIVAAQAQAQQEKERDGDVVMTDGVSGAEGGASANSPALSNSWVLVPGEDWEMIDCGA